MAKIVFRTADSGVLWHLIFAPFVCERDKDLARKELRRRGQYEEPIEGIPAKREKE